MTLPNIKDYKIYPRMARWFSPRLLSRLLLNVIISQVFGQYADRRLMVAALDTVPDSKQLERTTLVPNVDFEPRPDGDFWFDFVADLGDSFDPTYAIAKLLAQPSLTINGQELPRGQLLVMGGDEVYPAATREAYQHQLRDPYSVAFPDPGKNVVGVPLYAVPGNHDWYDGLVMFLAFFCNSVPLHFGGWRSRQRRSYFALQLTDQWWLWCTDIQLDDDMDAPQAEYFRLIAKAMPEHSKIILCSAEPGWLYTHKTLKPYDICEYSAGLAVKAGRGHTVPIVLSGDTHHYSRYTADDASLFITSGGGGAFLHPTHQIPNPVMLPKWLKHDRILNLNSAYPDRTTSRCLLWRNALFAFTNADFALFVGVVYWLFGMLMQAWPHQDSYIFILGFFAVSLISYTRYQERTARLRNWTVSFVHAVAHTYAIYRLANFLHDFNAEYFSSLVQSFYPHLLLTLVEMTILGGFVGGTIFGFYLWITCAFLDMNSNDAFSAMRLQSYKNFLRIRIAKNNDVEIFPIGLRNVPRREQWRSSADGSTLEPPQPLNPHFIEKPIKFKTAEFPKVS